MFNSVKSLNVYESYQLGKFKQLLFSSSSRCTKSPLELIHSDVWTSPVSSLSGCWFYVVFVDDYSRYSWLYPVINKSDVFNCFVKFKLLAEKQFSTPIKQFQRDNGGEYTSNQFKDFLSQHGILHRLNVLTHLSKMEWPRENIDIL
jgi:transposase InsO family protein